jgi:hypothetical protein
MAWLDDRVWSHPKFTDLSPLAFRAYVYGVCYSSGFGTRGHLTSGQLQTIGAKPSIQTELVKVGLWEREASGVYIHDWDEHNGKRDERRARDRERKRLKRSQEHGIPQDSPQDVPEDVPQEYPLDWLADHPLDVPGARPGARK